MPAVIGYGAGLAVLLGVFDYTGGSLTGWAKDHSVDEVARKELLRSTHRVPLEDTLAELGEGRGMDFSLSLFLFFFLLLLCLGEGKS